MSERRPDIPAPLRRQVLMEAGHRCAIPTCRHPTTEVAHIIPWETVREHKFENLIALCPNDHTDYDAGRRFDRKSMLAYKANLAIIGSRYGDLERRVLEAFVMNPDATTIDLSGLLEPLLSYLLRDGMLARVGTAGGASVSMAGVGPVTPVRYALTERGRALVAQWRDAMVIDDD